MSDESSRVTLIAKTREELLDCLSQDGPIKREQVVRAIRALEAASQEIADLAEQVWRLS